MGSRVFISYCTTDKQVASAILDALEDRGLPCWMAPRNITPGVFWAEAICHAIAECDVFILVLSERSNGSKHVLREVELGVDGGCFLIPYRIEDVTPEPPLSYFVRVTHWLDAATPAPQHPRNLRALVDAVARGMAGADTPRPTGGCDAPRQSLCTTCSSVCSTTVWEGETFGQPPARILTRILTGCLARGVR